MRAAVLLLAAALLGAGCRAEQTPAPERAAAPVAPRARLVLEPPRIGVGQVATLERVVVTPPGHTPVPFAAPDEVPGLWILDVEELPTQKDPSRWVHRSRIRLRARNVGGFVFPGGNVEVEAPDGARFTLELPEQPIEVVSLLPDHPERLTPFGPRRGAPAHGAGAVWGAAAAGALTTLAVVGLVALARRRRTELRREAARPQPRGEPPGETARRELEAARARAEQDPFGAAHALALALRRYVSRRFTSEVRGRTSEELEATEPPFSMRSGWPAFVATLVELDRLRFRPASDAQVRRALSEGLGELLDRAERLVEDELPPQERP